MAAAHIAHALTARRTVSPVEPSEAMFALELGQLNAGAVFLVVALLATLVFGRFFCGWGCHLVALQDLCGWMMRRVGVRPRAFRSRLLAWLPVGLAFYMFGWPTLRRWWLPGSAPHPGFTEHLLTTDFWATFPGPWMSALTFLVCGFAAVYLLGAKGFCTYGCPYGALFGAADRLSPARILVSDACTGCGQCTANCTSNVRVHEEVRQHGMVVDSGCMKCMDCVSVCPTGALSFGYAYPPALRKVPAHAASRPYDLSARQEFVAAALCVAAVLTFRGLYDGPPLLLSAALGVVTVFVGFKLYALTSAPNVTVQNRTLKVAGRVRPVGWAFATAAAAWLVFTAHSGFVQWHRARGTRYLEQTGATWDQIRSGAAVLARTAAEREAAEQAYASFATADRWGIVDVGEVKLGLAWVAILRYDTAEAEQHLRAVVALHPRSPRHHQLLAEFLLWQGRHPEATEAYETVLALGPSTAEAHFQLGRLLVLAGRLDDAAVRYRATVDLVPSSLEAQYNLGATLRRSGHPRDAVDPLRAAQRLSPRDPQVLRELYLAHAESGDMDAAARVAAAADRPVREQLLADPSVKTALDRRQSTPAP